MSQVKALMHALVQNPSLLRRIVPSQATRLPLAGLSETEVRALSALVDAIATALRNHETVTHTINRGGAVKSGQGVEVTALVSLVALTGALSVLGTVSLVALSRSANGRTL